MPFKVSRFLLVAVLLAACSGSQAVPATPLTPTPLPFYTPTPSITREPQTRYISEIVLSNQPIPEFVGGLWAIRDFCFSIVPHALVEVGDHGLLDHLLEVTRVTIDDVSIEPIWIERTLVSRLIYEDGELIASHGDPISFCFDMNEYPLGTHTVRIETETTQGRKFAYEWQ
ncbi:MAG: hypothetical protein AAGK74_02125, partial [Chloroflexota bacterium]